MTTQPSITCPRCQRTSHHPKDIEEGYCGNCHQFTSGQSSLLGRLITAIDETERIAREATEGPWKWVDPGGEWKQALVGGTKPWRSGIGWRVIIPSAAPDVYPSKFDAAHIKRHAPDSVLRGCAADRKMLAAVQRGIDGHPGQHVYTIPGREEWACPECVEWNKTVLDPSVLTFMAERYDLEVHGG